MSRIQFAVTTIYHFLFVPLTIGLALFVAVLETMATRKKDEGLRKSAEFFGKLFLINFATGVVTGIVQEFQFGMNWSEYSRFVGDIFGAPLAIEALAAFFLESTFLGIWMFGRGKVHPKIHLASIWLVALGSMLSAYWILVANSFMQDPAGFVVRNGRAEMTDFFALIGNPHVVLQFAHVVSAALLTAAVFVAALSAYRLLKDRGDAAFRQTLRISVVVGLVSVLLVAGAGDAQGKYLIKHQPMKMAAAEALWETQQPAALSLFSVIDETNRKNTVDIAVPGMLSFMSYNNFTGEVKGINDLQAELEQELGPGNYIPPVTVCFWSFRVMVGLAMVMILVLGVALIFLRKDKILSKPWLLKALLVLLPLPYLCNSTGWVLTEMGRQPWLVYKTLLLSDGLSASVSSGYILVSLVGFTLIYTVLAAVNIFLMVRVARAGEKAAPAARAGKEEVQA